MEDSRTLYLDLMKRALTGLLCPDRYVPLGMGDDYAFRLDRLLKRWIRAGLHAVLAPTPFEVVRKAIFDPAKRAEGRDWPFQALTMVGLKRLDNLQFCIEDVLQRGVPGDLIETGVWRGGAAIFMQAILKSHGVRDRIVWVADSFEGLPPPDPGRFPADAGSRLHAVDFLRVSLEDVRRNFEAFGLLNEQVRFLKGFFHETLPKAAIERLSVLRFDGDMYSSTMDVLECLYEKVSPGGYVIIDDYGAVPACARAVVDFRDRRKISERIMPIDWTGVYWRKA